MTAYLVGFENLPPLFRLWSKSLAVHVPVRLDNGFYDFVPWTEDLEIAWDYDLAYNSLKRFFLPPEEDLLRFDLAAYTAEPVFEAPDILLFGVHPYDLSALNQIDQIMDAGSPDANYLKRRDAAVIMALDPLQVADTAFWTTMGADRVDLGFDLYFTRIGPGSLLVEVGTPRGEELLLSAGPLTTATSAEREAARRARRSIRARVARKSLALPWRDVPKLLDRNRNSPLWRDKSRYCLSCGSCVMVCPTCYCFEVRDEADLDLKAGRRFREWHGCMLPAFQLVAGGHNFWPLPMDRYRHRYFRKGKYIYEKIGVMGCVGCGRCVRACTAGIANPLAVFNELWEAERHVAP